MEQKPIDKLKRRIIEIGHLRATLYLLDWDSAVNMPKKGADIRAETISTLSTLIHKNFTNIDHDGLLTSLKEDLDKDRIGGDDAVIVRYVLRDFERQQKLSEEFVKEQSELQSKAQKVWEEAREKSDFKMFQPYLEKIVALKRKEAEMVGYKESPYDALIDVYEPWMTTSEASKILNDIKDFSIPFLKKVKNSKTKIDETKSHGDFPIEEQKEFNTFIAELMGFNFDAGKVDISTHPFTTSFHPQDVRFTTRYEKNDVWNSVGSTIHETGHALYEQGLPTEHFGTPLGEYISLGIHESQSRMWENQIGKSEEFITAVYPELQKRFPKPFKNLDKKEFHRIVNKVEPSFIRVEADELTYNLHIIIRFEIEKSLIEGSIKVSDLPKIWNAKYKEYLGVDIKDDSHGVLQDVHWSAGLFGYFPTYSLGNLYAAQFYYKAKGEIKNFDKKIAKGELRDIREWLREKIHIHGMRFTAGEIVREVTGEDLNADYFSKYIKEKYSKIYNLE